MQNINKGILQTLAYFDLFRYPLTGTELYFYHPQKLNGEAEFQTAIDQLVAEGLVFKLEQFYSLREASELAERRIKANELATQQLQFAHKAARRASAFPFVKGLAVSGSLSKNYADEHTDVDFFVIAQANRLWLARTFLQLFYKFNYFTGKQKHYCFNYYVDETALTVPEQNMFTAIETVTAIPAYGNGTMKHFFEANAWALQFLPQADFRQAANTDSKTNWVRRSIEWLLNNRLGNWIDNQLMRITASRWKKKEQRGERADSGKRLGLITTKHVAKPNPAYFQKNILENLDQRIRQLTGS